MADLSLLSMIHRIGGLESIILPIRVSAHVIHRIGGLEKCKCVWASWRHKETLDEETAQSRARYANKG